MIIFVSRAPASPPVILKTAMVGISVAELTRLRIAGWNWEIRANGNEGGVLGIGWEPGNFLERNREDGFIGDGEGVTHGAGLGVAAKFVDEAFAVEGLNVVENDSDAGAGGFQNFEDAEKFLREAASGPG